MVGLTASGASKWYQFFDWTFLEKSISSIFRLRETFTYWMTNVGQRVEMPKQKLHPHYSAYRVGHLPTPMAIGPEREAQLVGIILEDVTLVQDSRVAFWSSVPLERLSVLSDFILILWNDGPCQFPYFVCLVPQIKGRYWDHWRLVLQSEIKERTDHHTFSYLANPVVKMFTVNIVPGHTRVTFQLTTILNILIIIRFSISPIFIWNLY